MNHKQGESERGGDRNDLKWTFRARTSGAESRVNRLLSLLLALAVLAVITLGWERVWNVQRPASVETSLRLVQDYCTASTPEEREKAWEAVLASAKAQKLFLNIDLPLDDGLTCALSRER